MGRGGVNQERRMNRFEEICDLCMERRLTQEEAALMLGVSDRTFHHWSKRHEDGGVDALI